MTVLRTNTVSNLPDNVTGDISPSDVRNNLTDFIDTMTPAYSVAGLAPDPSVSVGTIPQDIAGWQAPIVITPEFAFDETTGVATLQANMVVRFQVQLDLQFGANRFVTVQTSFSGSGTPGVYKSRVEGAGNNDPAFVALTGIFDGTIGDTLKFQLSADSSTTVGYAGGIMILELIPLINDPS